MSEDSKELERTSRIPETKVVDEVYVFNKKTITLLMVTILCAFAGALLLNFPFSGGIKPMIAEKIDKNRACPISYQSLDIGYFLPKVILDHPTVAGRCFGSPGKNISFDEAILKITMPSFWPIGIKTKFHAKSKDALVNIFPRIAIGGHSVQVENTSIKGSFLNQFLPFSNLLKGDIKVQGNFDFNDIQSIQRKQVERGNFRLSSKNLLIPSQDISGFSIPMMALRTLDFAGTITKKKVHIKALRLGDSKSKIQAEFKGSIILSLRNINSSTLNLEGKLRIDDSILNSIGLLRIMLNGKKKKDGFYFLQLKGSFAAPQPIFVDPV